MLLFGSTPLSMRADKRPGSFSHAYVYLYRTFQFFLTQWTSAGSFLKNTYLYIYGWRHVSSNHVEVREQNNL